MKKTSKVGLTKDEVSAMKDYLKELNNDKKLDKKNGEKAIAAALAKMNETDRKMGERIHEIITSTAPTLIPRTWYGMPAYSKDDKIICFFQNAGKFKARYSTLGFSDKANLDEGKMWPTGFALTELTPAEEKRITALVKKAVSGK